MSRTGRFPSLCLVGAVLVASGCTHRLAATASEPLELTTSAPDEAPPSEPSLAVEVRPGGLVAHLMFADDDAIATAGDGSVAPTATLRSGSRC